MTPVGGNHEHRRWDALKRLTRVGVASVVLAFVGMAGLGVRPAGATPYPSPTYPSAAWEQREEANYAITAHAPAQQQDAAFQSRLAAQNEANSASLAARQAAEPTWNYADNLCATWMWQCAGDPFRYAESPGPNGGVDAGSFYRDEATVTPVNFYDRGCAKISGRVWLPKGDTPRTVPEVVIETGSIQAPETIYWWFAQALVRNGYAVMTFDVRGQGRSDSTAPRPPTGDNGQGSNQNGVVFTNGLVDAIDFFRSTAADPYTWTPGCAALTGAAKPASMTNFNPIWTSLDQSRLGIAGHSLGAGAVSTVQGYSPWPGKQAIDGGANPVNPVDVTVAWDSLSAPGVGTTARTPALNMSSEYGIGGAAKTAPPASDGHLGGFRAFRAAGQPTMSLSTAGSTHFEWSLIPTFPSSAWRSDQVGPTGDDPRENNLVAEYYSLAWMDRWLKHPNEGPPQDAGYGVKNGAHKGGGIETADARLLNDGLFRNRMSVYYCSARNFPNLAGVAQVSADIKDGTACPPAPVSALGAPSPTVPETRFAAMLPIVAIVLGGGALFALRRRRAT